MNPEEIVEAAFSMGVTLHVEGGKLSVFGAMPDNWIEICTPWVEHRQAVIDWITTTPSEAHRSRLLKVILNKIKKRMKLPCLHLGALIERKPSCGCGARHECGLHGECVISGASAKWRVCSRCPDYEAGNE